jgi:hypothetical protein
VSTLNRQTVNGDAPGLWLNVSELARARGIDKAAVSRRVARLVQIGALETRPGARGTKLINVAAFDRAIGETGDLAHAQAREPDDAPLLAPATPTTETASATYTREQAREKSYAADLKKLDLDERLGKLVTVESVQAGAVRLAETLVRQIDQITGRADDIAAAVAKDGVQGARGALKTVAREIRESMARELERLADTAQAEHQAQDETDE